MTEEQLEKTGIISEVVNSDVTIEERLEEILDKLEYNDLPIWKKNQINGLIEDIKKSKTNDKKAKLFCELLNLMDEN